MNEQAFPKARAPLAAGDDQTPLERRSLRLCDAGLLRTGRKAPGGQTTDIENS